MLCGPLCLLCVTLCNWISIRLMKHTLFTIVLTGLVISTAFAQKNKKAGFRFIDHIDKKQIDLEYNGQVMTAYCYYDSLMKPILFPLNTVSGVTVTRGFPLDPKPGERV